MRRRHTANRDSSMDYKQHTTDESAILFDYAPTGASATTAGYDNLPAGVASSRTMAGMDIVANSQFTSRFEIAGDLYDIPPAVIAAIASRETRAGTGLDANGFGDSGNAVGILQIDINWHTPVAIGPDFGSQGHINQAMALLDAWRDEAAVANPSWTAAQLLQAGIAAYNGGPVVFNDGPLNFDLTTDGGDYSNDVWARAQWYAEHWSLM